MGPNAPVGGYKNFSASANCSPNPCGMLGFFINSVAATATIQFYDDAGTGTTTPITGVMTAAAGILVPGWYPLPVATTKGLYVVIAVAAMNVTVVFAP